MPARVILCTALLLVAWTTAFNVTDNYAPGPAAVPVMGPTPVPARVPGTAPTPVTPVPPLPVSITIAQPLNGVVTLLDQRLYNDSCSVPAWVRTDVAPVGVSAALPTLVVADDFLVPAAVDACATLTVDIGLLRAMGRTPQAQGGNARLPSRALLYLWPDAGFYLGVPWGVAAPLVEEAFAIPTDPAAWASAAYGYTINTTSVFNHIESLRFSFAVPGAGVVGGRSYWVGLAIALDRNYNSSDFSQNQPRWMVTTNAALAAGQALNGGKTTQQYRVIDAQAPNGAPMFRAAPVLANWTNASAAEPTVLPFISTQPQHSTTLQLALGVFASNCSVYSTAGLVTSAVMPPRVVDTVEQAVWAPPPVPSPSFPLPAPFPSPAVPPSSIATSSPAVRPVPSPWPLVQVFAPSPSAAQVPFPPADTTVQTPPAQGMQISLILIIVAAVVVVLLIVGALWLIVWRWYRRKYVGDYGEIVTEHDVALRPFGPHDADGGADSTDVDLDEEEEDEDAEDVLPSETAMHVAFSDHPATLIVQEDGDAPDVAAVKQEYDEQVMVPEPLDEKSAPSKKRKKKKATKKPPA